MAWAVAVDDVNFQAMLRRARELRRQLDELGWVSGSAIEASVHARLKRTPQPPELPPGQGRLADEILALLENPRLSFWQSHELAQAFRAG